jgi:hypothetical protein
MNGLLRRMKRSRGASRDVPRAGQAAPDGSGTPGSGAEDAGARDPADAAPRGAHAPADPTGDPADAAPRAAHAPADPIGDPADAARRGAHAPADATGAPGDETAVRRALAAADVRAAAADDNGRAGTAGAEASPAPRASGGLGAPATDEPDRPARDPNFPAGLDPPEAAARPPAGRRGKLRRRLRYLRRARELMLRDLGGLVYEVHRTGGGDLASHAGLVRSKVERVSALDAEAHALEGALGAPREEILLFEPGVGGTCTRCGELYGSDASFCSHCGAPTSGDAEAEPEAPASEGAPTLAGVAPEPAAPMPEPPPQRAAPGAEAPTSVLTESGDQATESFEGSAGADARAGAGDDVRTGGDQARGEGDDAPAAGGDARREGDDARAGGGDAAPAGPRDDDPHPDSTGDPLAAREPRP